MSGDLALASVAKKATDVGESGCEMEERAKHDDRWHCSSCDMYGKPAL